MMKQTDNSELSMLYSSFFSIMLLSMLIWGEARGEDIVGKQAVAWVVRNRVYAARNYGKDWTGVMLKKKAFSCFNEKDVNREKVEEVMFDRKTWKEFKIGFNIAIMIHLGFGFDPTIGATHYFNKRLSPSWARKMIKTAVIGEHVFYKYADE